MFFMPLRFFFLHLSNLIFIFKFSIFHQLHYYYPLFALISNLIWTVCQLVSLDLFPIVFFFHFFFFFGIFGSLSNIADVILMVMHEPKKKIPSYYRTNRPPITNEQIINLCVRRASKVLRATVASILKIGYLIVLYCLIAWMWFFPFIHWFVDPSTRITSITQ